MSRSKKTENGNVTRHSWRFRLTLFAVLFLAIIALFHVFVFSDKMLDSSDQILAGVFFRSFYVDYVHEHGKVPVWNPYQFCGIPYIDGFHGDTFYPFSIIKFFMSAWRALGWNMLLHVFIGGITMFACARVLRRSQMASSLAAVSYMFAAYFISQVAPGHDGKMFVTSLFPLTIMFIELGFRNRPLIYFSLLGLTIGIIILSPHPQMAYYTLWACAFYVVFKLISRYVDTKSVPSLISPTILFAAAVVIGLAISAIQFYPGYVYVQKYSPRSDEKRGEDWARSWSLHWEETASMVVPEFCGVKTEKEMSYWGKNGFKDNSEYAGAVPLLLALVAVMMVRSRKTWFFGGLALFAVIYGLAGNTPFFYLFYHLIPNVKSTRAWSMIMFLFSFSVALLAAFGLDFIVEQSRKLKGQERRTFGIALFGLPALVFIAALFFAAAPQAAIGIWKGIFYSNMPPQKNMILQNHLSAITAGFWITSLFLIGSSVVAWIYSRRKAGVMVLWVIVVLALVDAYRFDLKFIRTFDQANAFSTSPLVSYFKSIPDKFRVLDLTNRYLPTNYLPMFGIEEMTSYHGNQPRWYHRLLGGTEMRNMGNRNLMAVTNTRFLLIASPEMGERLARAGYREVNRWQNFQVFENPAANDRAYLVHEWIIDSNENKIDQIVLSDSFDPRKQVGVMEDPGIEMVTDSTAVASDKVVIESYENDYIAITTRSQSDGILVLADNWYPAWKGFIDGQEVKVMRVNGAFRGVVVSAGEHQIEFKYISSTQKAGRWLTLAGLAAVALMVVGGVIQQRRKDRVETGDDDE